MKIGVDFDNTIVCYDALFHTLASERDLVDQRVPVSKGAVRDHLRAQGHEETWIAMQGEVYGDRITEANAFPSVESFFRLAHTKSAELFIVSHKTRHPFRGPQYDLHAAAQNWLKYNGFISGEAPLLPTQNVYLELTKEDKWARIESLGCDYFIDDLPEFLSGPGFPEQTTPILFDPGNLYPDHDLTRLQSWNALQNWLTRQHEFINKGTHDGLS